MSLCFFLMYLHLDIESRELEIFIHLCTKYVKRITVKKTQAHLAWSSFVLIRSNVDNQLKSVFFSHFYQTFRNFLEFKMQAIFHFRCQNEGNNAIKRIFRTISRLINGFLVVHITQELGSKYIHICNFCNCILILPPSPLQMCNICCRYCYFLQILDGHGCTCLLLHNPMHSVSIHRVMHI